jgi:AcrR family transcriptional regulator
MTSNRHNRTDDDTVLDAARDCVLAVGVRRTTLTDVAKRAGVSRMTLYRRWPDVRTLVGDLMTREWIAVATDAAVTAKGDTARERSIEKLVTGIKAFREHRLFRKIVEVDPELLLPYMFDRRGASQEALLEFIAADLSAGHQDGTIHRDHLQRQARALLLVVQSYALSLQTMAEDPAVDEDLAPAAFYEELRFLLERTLSP